MHKYPTLQRLGCILARSGAVKEIVIGALTVAILTALVVSGGTLGIVIAGAFVAYSAYHLTSEVYKIAYSKDVSTGRKLDTLERYKRAGELFGGFVGGLLAPKGPVSLPSTKPSGWTSTMTEPVPFEGSYPTSENALKFNSTSTSELAPSYSRTTTQNMRMVEVDYNNSETG
jgi:hypothetical protein